MLHYRMHESCIFSRHKMNRGRKRALENRYNLPTMVPSYTASQSTPDLYHKNASDQPSAVVMDQNLREVQLVDTSAYLEALSNTPVTSMAVSDVFTLENTHSPSKLLDSFSADAVKKERSLLHCHSPKGNNDRVIISSPSEHAPFVVKEDIQQANSPSSSNTNNTANSDIPTTDNLISSPSAHVIADDNDSDIGAHFSQHHRTMPQSIRSTTPLHSSYSGSVGPQDLTNNRTLPPSDSNFESRRCPHCEIIFPDNIMYGLHMGCHAVGKQFQCNICGEICSNKHDFMFHFSLGRHKGR